VPRSWRPPVPTRWLLRGLATLAVLLIGAEGTLWYAYGRTERKPPSADARRVLCLGDSYTLAGPLERHEAFPAQLAQQVNQGQGPTLEVVNLGGCELNTAQVRAQLPVWLDRYEPHGIILMVGAANRFQPWGSPGAASPAGPIGQWLGRSRLAALARSWLTRRSAHTVAPVTTAELLAPPLTAATLETRLEGSRVRQAKRWYSSFLAQQKGILLPEDGDTVLEKKAGEHRWLLRVLDQALLQSPGDVTLHTARVHLLCNLGRVEQARSVIDQLLAASPDSEIVLDAAALLAVFEGRQLFVLGRHVEAMEVALQAIAIDPGEYHHYYWLAKSLQYQKELDAREVVLRLEGFAEQRPDTARHPTYRSYLELFRGWDSSGPETERWLREDLDAMATMIEDRGAALVVQTYPFAYPVANQALRDLAEQRGLVLIDQEPVFEATYASPARDLVWLDDDQLTMFGNMLLAKSLRTKLDEAGWMGTLSSVDP
jgi:tetratricopeptide (TPR) repeat protein